MMQKLKLKNKTICVTGASGVIGKVLISRLLNYDCNINILSRKKLSNFTFSKKIKIFQGDLSNPILDLQPFLENCDYIINCAAELNQTKLMYQVNTQSVYRLLTAINKNFQIKKKKIHWIQLSSCGVYGSDRLFYKNQEYFVSEDTIPIPQNEYEKTKLAADNILISYSKKNLIDYTILRPSTVINQKIKSNIFNKLNRLIKKKLFIRNSKKSIATYVHIDDLVNSIILIICNQKSKNNIFNLSINCHWNKIIEKICDFNQVKLSNIFINYKLLFFPLHFLRVLLGKFLYIPTLQTFELKNFFLSTKIEKRLNFKFKNLLPNNVENFFLIKTYTKTNISLSKKKLNFEKLKDLNIQSNNNILVSIVMSVYNGEQYIAQTIDSMLSQTMKNFEFIIVNDGSTDSSLEIIQNFSKNDNRIIIINKSNSGITHSLNCAINIAKGDWVARIDSDDISCKNRLMEQYLRGVADDSLALIGSSCFEIDEFGNKLKHYIYPEKHDDLKNNLENMGNFFPHSSYFIRTKLLKKINGYKLRMMRSQDYDLSLRLSNLGNITSIQQPLIFLRKHKKSISYNDQIGQIVFPRLSLINYNMNKLNLSGPLDENVSLEDFKILFKIVKKHYNFSRSNFFSLAIKTLINQSRYNFFSNKWFATEDKNKFLDIWFKILFNKN